MFLARPFFRLLVRCTPPSLLYILLYTARMVFLADEQLCKKTRLWLKDLEAARESKLQQPGGRMLDLTEY